MSHFFYARIGPKIDRASTACWRRPGSLDCLVRVGRMFGVCITPEAFIKYMDIFCEQRSTGEARLRFDLGDGEAGIVGTVRGPFSAYSSTLPSSYAIRQGRCVVVDPCYWTPALPFHYEVEVKADGSEFQFQWGIRWCVPHRGDIRLGGKRFVFRAIEFDVMASGDVELSLRRLRELKTGLIVPAPNDALCQLATKHGILLFAVGDMTDESLCHLNGYAGVHFATGCRHGTDLLTVSPAGDSRGHIELLDANQVEESDGGGVRHGRPQFISRRTTARGIDDLRDACDALQRDMARFGQFAGYLITTDS